VVRVLSSDGFELPLPPGHRFPARKYGMLRERVQADGVAVDLEPPAASRAELGRVHIEGYLERVFTGTLEKNEARRIGLPWSPAMLERSRRSTGATVVACDAALAEGAALYLAGGTHHAFADRGEGFCVFNDVAVAARALLEAGRVGRVCVVDLDVHQGNGTAAIFADDPRVFTFSVHGAGNYPFHKTRSDVDVALPDRTGDLAYLQALDAHLDAVLDRADPDLVVYIAGADVYAGDRLGRLALSPDGIAARDRRVFDACRRRGLPWTMVMGGGYAEPIEETVAIQHRTVRIALEAAADGHASVS
jgi:acetoin utilization deacetylase AcuC-like enzyme